MNNLKLNPDKTKFLPNLFRHIDELPFLCDHQVSMVPAVGLTSVCGGQVGTWFSSSTNHPGWLSA